jgi:hypothetical protein
MVRRWSAVRFRNWTPAQKINSNVSPRLRCHHRRHRHLRHRRTRGRAGSPHPRGPAVRPEPARSSYGRHNRQAIAARETRVAARLRAVEQAYQLAIDREVAPGPPQPATATPPSRLHRRPRDRTGIEHPSVRFSTPVTGTTTRATHGFRHWARQLAAADCDERSVPDRLLCAHNDYVLLPSGLGPTFLWRQRASSSSYREATDAWRSRTG